MEGNGQFIVKPANDKMSVRLEFDQQDGGGVAVTASLGDGTAQALCVFLEGELILCDCSVEIAKKMGVELDSFGYIKVSSRKCGGA